MKEGGRERKEIYPYRSKTKPEERYADRESVMGFLESKWKDRVD